MNLILPVGGQSSRFPEVRPKWMLTHPNGNLMIAESFHGWDLSPVEKILIVALRQHDEQYAVQSMLHKQFKKLGLADKLQIVIIEGSQSQPDTVYQGLKLAEVQGPIFIKDSDNYFTHTLSPGNSVCYGHIDAVTRGPVTNKSYILLNEQKTIINIVEKRLISETFCCGGYGFASADEFCKIFENLKAVPNLYISHIIYQMILGGVVFSGVPVQDYVDWGTLNDWQSYRRKFSTLFIDLDGVLVENSAEFFKPYWGDTEAISKNVAVINELYESGYAEIIITTTRNSDAEGVTIEQLNKIGLKYHRILFGLLHAKRIVINDFSKTNPYRSCDSINLARNSDQLAELLSGLISTPIEE
jgi:hypothetical protein